MSASGNSEPEPNIPMQDCGHISAQIVESEIIYYTDPRLKHICTICYNSALSIKEQLEYNLVYVRIVGSARQPSVIICILCNQPVLRYTKHPLNARINCNAFPPPGGIASLLPFNVTDILTLKDFHDHYIRCLKTAISAIMRVRRVFEKYTNNQYNTNQQQFQTTVSNMDTQDPNMILNPGAVPCIPTTSTTPPTSKPAILETFDKIETWEWITLFIDFAHAFRNC